MNGKSKLFSITDTGNHYNNGSEIIIMIARENYTNRNDNRIMVIITIIIIIITILIMICLNMETIIRIKLVILLAIISKEGKASDFICNYNHKGENSDFMSNNNEIVTAVVLLLLLRSNTITYAIYRDNH